LPSATGPDSREKDASILLYSALYFFCVLASYYIFRPIRDQAAVAGGVHNLPWLFTGTLAAMLVANPLFSALVARYTRRRFIPLSYRFFILNLIIFFYFFNYSDASSSIWAGRIFYIWTSVFNLFVVSIFWAFMADTFSSEEGKRVFGLIAVGGTLGGIFGSGITASLSEILGPVYLLLISALLLECGLFCFNRILRERQERTESHYFRPVAAGNEIVPETADPTIPLGGGPLAGIINVLKSPYLRGISGYLLLYTILSTFLYFQQAQLFAAHFTDQASRTAAFARVDLNVNILTLLTQIFLTGRIIRKFGIGLSLGLLPMVCVLGFLWMSFYPGIIALVILQVIKRSSNFAVSRPARETLFTVLSRENKYKAKSFIDTFVYRLGDQIGAWSWAVLSRAGLGVAGISMAAVPASIGWFLAAIWLGRKMKGYGKDG